MEKLGIPSLNQIPGTRGLGNCGPRGPTPSQGGSRTWRHYPPGAGFKDAKCEWGSHGSGTEAIGHASTTHVMSAEGICTESHCPMRGYVCFRLQNCRGRHTQALKSPGGSIVSLGCTGLKGLVFVLLGFDLALVWSSLMKVPSLPYGVGKLTQCY